MKGKGAYSLTAEGFYKRKDVAASGEKLLLWLNS